jgi:hypothetical protein
VISTLHSRVKKMCTVDAKEGFDAKVGPCDRVSGESTYQRPCRRILFQSCTQLLSSRAHLIRTRYTRYTRDPPHQQIQLHAKSSLTTHGVWYLLHVTQSTHTALHYLLVGVTWPGGREVISRSYHIRAERGSDPAEQAASPYMGMSRMHCDVFPTAYYLSAAHSLSLRFSRKVIELIQLITDPSY